MSLAKIIRVIDNNRKGIGFCNNDDVCDLCEKLSTKYVSIGADIYICKTCLNEMSGMIDKAILNDVDKYTETHDES